MVCTSWITDEGLAWANQKWKDMAQEVMLTQDAKLGQIMLQCEIIRGD